MCVCFHSCSSVCMCMFAYIFTHARKQAGLCNQGWCPFIYIIIYIIVYDPKKSLNGILAVH